MDSSLIDDILRLARRESEAELGYNLERLVGQPVLPGMMITVESQVAPASWSFGPGLSYVPQPTEKRKTKSLVSMFVSQFGILKCSVVENEKSNTNSDGQKNKSQKAPTKHCLWVERPIQTASIPRSLAPISRSTFRCTVNQLQVGDRVVGVVVRRAADFYLVDVGCTSFAILNYLAFEGASKKNRPDIGPGDVIYAVVTQADRDLDLELACIDEVGRASGMGILGRYEPGTVGNAGGMAGGVMLHCPPELVRRLSSANQFPLLDVLAKTFPFEVVMGANGRIWLTTRAPRETMLIANAIAMAEHASPVETFQFAATL